jgi:hypothetical protein
VHNGGISISFAWKDYLELAEELSVVLDSEAKMRSSISRAYYASYCNVRNYMIEHDHNMIPKGESVHQYVIEYFWGFKRESKKTAKRREIAIILDRMKKRRIDADYEDCYPAANLVILNSQTQKTLLESKRILSIINTGSL